ncbi:MAG: xanthine dehydrogenase family protein subunit M [Candidatus Brocadiae bacterium]|nr:xanthine dehydrogenase family protein subunit M [Candidatus Brocadiia bacterium]
MRAFRYEEPRSVEEAIAVMGRPGKNRLLAGGTDLLVRLKRREWTVDAVINLKRIAGLGGIEDRGDHVFLGPLTTLEEIGRSELLAARWPMLRETVHEMGSPQVRAMSTVGGNLCNASPAADMAPPLLCLDAVMTARGPQGERLIRLQDFFAAPGRTVLAPGELVTAIRIPPAPAKGCFIKFCTRRAMDLAFVSVACAAVGNDIRLALGAVAPTPIRVPPSVEEAVKRCAPIDDVRASAEYRREMVRVLVRRALARVAS